MIEPREYLEDGDYVLALTRYRMRGAGSGVYLEAPWPTSTSSPRTAS